MGKLAKSRQNIENQKKTEQTKQTKYRKSDKNRQKGMGKSKKVDKIKKDWKNIDKILKSSLEKSQTKLRKNVDKI